MLNRWNFLKTGFYEGIKLAAVEYVDRELGVETVEDALGGARDIIAEWVNEETTARGKLRKLFWSQGTFSSKVVSGKASEAAKYRNYFEWEEPVIDVPSHRLLAMLRGERERHYFRRISRRPSRRR